jgi:predicted ATPase
MIDVSISLLKLSPLPLAEVAHILADTLHASLENVDALAALCYSRTGGNPFFLNQLLQYLYQNQLIQLDKESEHWVWDISTIQQEGITESIAHLMTLKIQKLKPETQAVLKLAACLDHHFELNRLAAIYHQSLDKTAADLWEALEAGLILAEDESYKYIPSEGDEETHKSDGFNFCIFKVIK